MSINDQNHDFEYDSAGNPPRDDDLDFSELRKLSDMSDISPEHRPDNVDSVGYYPDGLGDLESFRKLAGDVEPEVPVDEYTVPSPADDFDFTQLTRRIPPEPPAEQQKNAKKKEKQMPEEKQKKEKTLKVERRQKTGCFGGLLFFAFIIGISMLLAVVAWVAATDVLALGKDEATAIIEVGEDDDMRSIAKKLEAGGIIRYPWLFRLFGVISDAEENISEGSFELDTTMDYRAIVSAMGGSSAARLTITVTIPEGYELSRILQLLSDYGVAELSDLQNTAANYDFEYSFLDDIPLGVDNRLEGYLFPDTYEFYLGESTVTAINKLLSNFNSKFDSEMRDRAAEMGYSIYEIVTIASLIEKEAAADSERATIASVIYNRLSSAEFPYLQIDATIQYILPERKEELSYDDLAIDDPYNTYVYEGLPPGPIANPGRASLRAALYPEETPYYFYALNEDGLHKFSETVDEHNAFVQQMQEAGVIGY